MQLSDLKNSTSLRIEDFDLSFGPNLTLNSKTSSQLAAYDMLLSDDPSGENFESVRDNLNTDQGRKQFINRQDIRRAEIVNSLSKDLYKDLLDPELSDEQKVALIGATQQLPQMYTYRMLDLAAQEAVGLETDINETDREVDSRLNFLDFIERTNQRKRELQSIVNGAQLGKDGSNLVDIAELAVPFAELIHINRLLKNLGEGDERGVLLGERKRYLFDLVRNMPLKDREALTQFIVSTINDNDTVVLPDGNDLVAAEALSNMLLENDYSNVERWFDNAMSVLDVIGVGALLSGVVKGTLKGGRGIKAISNIPEEVIMEADESLAKGLAETTYTDVKPTSPSQVVKEASPDQAKVMHDMADQDDTGKAAEALYGTSREEAMAKDLLPEPDVKNRTFKVNMDSPENLEPTSVRLNRGQDGKLYLTDVELNATNVRIAKRLEDIEGFKLQPQSMSIAVAPDGSTNFSMLYHPTNVGWKTADDAIGQTLYALRQFGVDESDIQLLRRLGDEWQDVTSDDLKGLKTLRDEFTRRKQKIPADLKEIDWAVAVNYNHKFNAADDIINQTLDPKWNFLDRFNSSILSKLGQGSLLQNLMPITGVLHPTITGSAAVAFDKAINLRKLYVDNFKPFTDTFKGLNKDRRIKVLDYIQDANLKGIPLNTTQLKAAGFTDKEIEALKGWRKANDMLYWSTNSDMVVTLRNRGYQVFTNGDTVKLFVKPISDKAVNTRTMIYNTLNDKAGVMSRKELDEFVESGGSFARLNEPTQIDGEWVQVVSVPNTKDGGYLRALRDNDTVLHYRQGYYPVMYDANWFVRMEVGDGNGGTFQKTVGSARTQKEALELKERLEAEAFAKAEDAGKELDEAPRIIIDRDRNTDADRYNGLSEDGFSIAASSSLSAQKVRGQRLMDAGVDYHNAGHSNLIDPLEAVAIQVAKLSNRIHTRNWFEATKKRWINSYFDKLGMQPNKFGEQWFPNSINDIPSNPGISSRITGDARTLFNYIHSLENGYINGIDEGLRSVINSLSEFAGEKGLTALELFGKDTSRKSIMGETKGVVFKLYLAANPARQAVVQGHQTIQLIPLFPKYVLGGGLANDLYRVSKAYYGFTDDVEAVEMLNQLKRSGMLEAVDANNMVRSDMLRLAERTNLQKVGKGLGAPLRFTQRIGFDIGEQTVLVTSWLAHRADAISKGRKLTQRELERIAGKSRAYTYNMNRAGDMPYNSNTLNLFAQFLQVPHKFMAQQLFDRNLSRVDRAKLISFNTIMYGVPAGIFASYLSGMEDGPVKDSLQYGLEDVLLNGVITAVTGEQQTVDWGDFAPADMLGTSEFAINLLTLDVGRLIEEMPAYNLLFDGNSRLAEMFKTITRYVYTPADYEDPRLETKFSDVAIASMQMFSGFSNFFKARYAAQSGRKLSSLGNVTDEDVTKFEAVMQLFGFRTKEETSQQEINRLIYGNDEYPNMDTDVRLWYNEFKRHIARRGQSIKDEDMSWRALAEGWRVFELYDVKARESLRRAIESDIKKGDLDFITNIRKQVGNKDVSEIREMIVVIPDKDLRNRLMQDLDNYQQSIDRIKKQFYGD